MKKSDIRNWILLIVVLLFVKYSNNIFVCIISLVENFGKISIAFVSGVVIGGRFVMLFLPKTKKIMKDTSDGYIQKKKQINEYYKNKKISNVDKYRNIKNIIENLTEDERMAYKLECYNGFRTLPEYISNIISIFFSGTALVVSIKSLMKVEDDNMIIASAKLDIMIFVILIIVYIVVIVYLVISFGKSREDYILTIIEKIESDKNNKLTNSETEDIKEESV